MRFGLTLGASALQILFYITLLNSRPTACGEEFRGWGVGIGTDRGRSGCVTAEKACGEGLWERRESSMETDRDRSGCVTAEKALCMWRGTVEEEGEQHRNRQGPQWMCN